MKTAAAARVFPARAHPAVKVCGLTRLEDVLHAAEGGAWALGFVLAPSPRRVTVDAAAAMMRALRERVPPGAQPLAVGVFVDEGAGSVAEAVRLIGLDAVQLHGAESPDEAARVRQAAPDAAVIKAFPVGADAREEGALGARVRVYLPVVDGVLLDTRVGSRAGGKGVSFPWALARVVAGMVPVLVAGGIGPHNAARALAESKAWGVDASSALERAPGVKDPAKVTRLLRVVGRIGAADPDAGV